MTIDQLIAQIRQAMQARLTERETHTQAIAAVRTTCAAAENRNPTDAEAAQVRAAQDSVRGIDTELEAQRTRITELEAERDSDTAAQRLASELVGAGAPGQREHRAPATTSEQRTYSAHRSNRGEASFFVDAYRMQAGDMAARSRLERHAVEVEREGELTERATTTGSFGGLVVPQYLVDMAALAVRAGRPLANSVTGLPLPAQGMTLSIPRGTTGAAVGAQATENTALQNTDEVFSDLVIPVRTIGGQQDVSRQSLERGTPGIDEMVYMDLSGAYHAELDRQVANGSGASGQMLGIFQTAGITAAAAFGAVASAANINRKLAGAVAAVAGVGFGIDPKLIAMNPRRWGFLTGEVDSTGRPLVNPGAPGAFNAIGINSDPGGYSGDPGNVGVRTVGSLQGLPVITDANIPTTVGTNVEDLIAVLDTSKALLWEDGDGMPRQLRFEETLAGQLTVKLVVYGYAAFTAGRYPQAFAKIGGVDTTATFGLVAPTF